MNRVRHAWLGGCLLAGCLLTGAAAAAGADQPSRKAFEHCAWEHVSDAAAGLAAWVQRCDYRDRKIDFLFQGKSLAMRYSDGGEPEPLVDVIDLAPGETAQKGIRRHFDANTDPRLARRCVLAPYKGYRAPKLPAGVRRYTFVPAKTYAKELKRTSSPDEVGEPPCGDWGDAPDGIQYFEAHASRPERVLFVRVGQDEPLFVEKTLRLLPPAGR